MNRPTLTEPRMTQAMQSYLKNHGLVAQLDDLYSVRGAHIYDALTRNDRSEIREFIQLSRRYPGRILDLGSGSGRLTLPLASLGHEVHALDNSATMLELLSERMPSRLNIQTHLRDMPDFSLGTVFDLVILGATSITLLNSSERQQLMRNVRSHLATNGCFALSLAGGEASEELSLAREGQMEIQDGLQSVTVYFSQEPADDGRSRLVNFADLANESASDGQVPVYTSHVRLLPAEEIIGELQTAGFTINDIQQVRSGRSGLGSGIAIVECQ